MLGLAFTLEFSTLATCYVQLYPEAVTHITICKAFLAITAVKVHV